MFGKEEEAKQKKVTLFPLLQKLYLHFLIDYVLFYTIYFFKLQYTL